MRYAILASLLAVIAFSLRAEEAPAPLDAKTLIADLGSDDFTARESAEQKLCTMGKAGLKAVREAAVATDDAEIRMRCKRIEKSLLVEAEDDPQVLLKSAREAALQRRYSEASKLYMRASELMNARVKETKTPEQAKALLALIGKADERARKAANLAGTAASEENEVMEGQVRIRRRIIVNGGIRIIANGGEDDAGKDDW